MRIYVASSWRNVQHPEVVRQLLDIGHDVYDFQHPSSEHSFSFHWSSIDPNWRNWTHEQFKLALVHPLAQDGLEADTEALEWCNALVLVMPCGRSSHIKLGHAIGTKKRSIILLDSESEPELMYGMADSLCTNMKEVIEALRGG